MTKHIQMQKTNTIYNYIYKQSLTRVLLLEFVWLVKLDL